MKTERLEEIRDFLGATASGGLIEDVYDMTGELLAEVDALTKRVEELEEALKLAQRWLGDAEDHNANFEDIAEWFRKDTGHLRPGKDSPFRDDDGARAAWEHWSKTMAIKIREAIRAALLTPDTGGKL